ncbi:hypothetical protein [Elizabethkingia ursingii]|uniref:Uncharacterized protein n=1 Tax=Elizabethkingia ursingii TaxID=1756150 RepID=A0ABX3NBB4_9FLAO|nr:hypothetical protein [Elizabethkingia ursingii]OPB87336.1 hypothetical protein BB021_08645 [Elizabethkingia ursingii]
MDLDNFKKIWKKEEINTTPEVSLERQKRIHMPLDKIRKNMRIEFWYTIPMMLVFIISAFFINDLKLRTYIIIILLSMTIVTFFYFSKFFMLYKNIGNNNLNTKDNLKNLLFQFELNRQYYNSYYVASVPFFVTITILSFEYLPFYKKIHELELVFVAIITVTSGLFALYFFGRWWFYEFYGKYIYQIVEILKEIGNPELEYNFGKNIFKINTKKNIYLRTENYLVNKTGSSGKTINILLWIFIPIICLIIFMFICGFIVGYLGLFK